MSAYTNPIDHHAFGVEHPDYVAPQPRPRAPRPAVTFAKLPDGSWGIKGFNLVRGQSVIVHKRSGETSEVIVGDVVAIKGSDTVARLGRPQEQQQQQAPAAKVTEAGFYLLNGQAYKVIESRDGSFLYGRMVTGHGLKKAPGIMNRLAPANKMTPAQIAAYGVETHVCVNCATELTDPASQGVGLGTKCGPEILGSEAYRAAYKTAKAAAEAAQAAADADEAAWLQGWEDASDEYDAEAALEDAIRFGRTQNEAEVLAHFGL
jgi:ribosomal protein L37AE/L43A